MEIALVIIFITGYFFIAIEHVISLNKIVAATMGMYPLETYPIDHNFWVLLAFCTGTGGSALIIGSAAGVAAMGLEKVPFGWYLKRIAWLALLGYFSGIGSFLLQEAFK